MITLAQVIQSLRPGAEWTLSGDEYSGLNWLDKSQTKPTETEVDNERARLEERGLVPNSVPLWAVRTVLENENLFDQAQSLIDASTDNALKNLWGYGNFADRDSTAINSLGAALGLSKDQIDQMFIDAGKITR